MVFKPINKKGMMMSEAANGIESNINNSVEVKKPMQRILFGSPGTGKSHKVHNVYLKDFDADNVIKTVFHPEYKYGDFMGRLMPLTKNGQVNYAFQAGHFMKALAKAYKNIVEVQKPETRKRFLGFTERNNAYQIMMKTSF